MSRRGLNTLLSWLVPIVLGMQINHILANRSDLDPFFNFAFYPENEGIAAYFGALFSTLFMFPLVYLTRWRAFFNQEDAWTRKVFRPNILEVDDSWRLGRTVLRVLLFFGFVLPLIQHIWLVDRALKDPDVYVRICAQHSVEKNPFTDPAVLRVYPQIEGKEYNACKKAAMDRSNWRGTAHCIESAGEVYCRISRSRAGHFQFPTCENIWSVVFGGGRESFKLGFDNRIVSYVPGLFPGIGVALSAILVLYWIHTLAMLFLPRVRFWLWHPDR